MRRQLGSLAPVLSQRYGIHPWDVERLTVDELAAYLEHLKKTTT